MQEQGFYNYFADSWNQKDMCMFIVNVIYIITRMFDLDSNYIPDHEGLIGNQEEISLKES